MSKKTWVTEGFEAFRRGTFGNAGHNLYVSKDGTLQRIFQYDLNRDGYVDLVFANCQDHGESAPTYVYTLDGQRSVLPAQGCQSGMTLDIDGDGYPDIVCAGFYDAAAPFCSADIYFGTEEGYSENYHIKLSMPRATDCCYGDFNGKGQPILAFVQPLYKTVRLFEKTRLGCYEWDGFQDIKLDFAPNQVAAADLDGDGYCDLILREQPNTRTVVYWGGPDGIQLDRFSVLHELPASEILQPEEAKTMESELEKKVGTPRLLQAVRWNGRDCFTLSTGKKVIFFSANADRQLERVLQLEVPLAQAVAVGDLDGDGLDDIAVAAIGRNEEDKDFQASFIIWNSPEGIDLKPRTVVSTLSACHVSILDNRVLFCQCNAGVMYTNDSFVFTYPDFKNPLKFEGEDPRRGSLVKDKDGNVYVVLINHFSRHAMGFDECYVYWGSKDGYSPDNMLSVPGHCAVDAMVADFDDDGWAELLIGNNSENSLHLDPGHHIHHFGPNGFEPERTHFLQTNIGWGSMCADFNRDGYLEIITSANHWTELRMYSAKDNFSSYEVIELPEGSNVRWPTAVDVNKDGWLDLVVAPVGSQRTTFILWGGPEGFSIERSQELSTYKPIGAFTADLSKNGYPDLIIGCHTEIPKLGELIPHHPHHSFVHIYWNGPDGISESRKCVLRGDACDHLAIADFNNDGWLDIFAGCYHGGKDRDINSFLYWNREGKFSETDKQIFYTHSASGCMAADFNEDGYIDLAVANHKVDGDHKGFSTVWWNGPNGFNRERSTDLPTCGPHGMITMPIGNALDRSYSEYYYSEAYTAESDCAIVSAYTEGEVPAKTAANLTFRVNGGEWVDADAIALKKGDTLEYRLELYAYNCLRTPRIRKVVVEFSN